MWSIPVFLSRFLKQEGFLVRFLRLNAAEKFWIWVLHISALKSPREIKFSYFEGVVVEPFRNVLNMILRYIYIRVIETKIRGGCSGLPLLPMQHPKKAYISFQAWVFFSKNVVNRFSNQSESSWKWHCDQMLSSAGGTFFHIVPFLIQFGISCNVLSILASSDN